MVAGHVDFHDFAGHGKAQWNPKSEAAWPLCGTMGPDREGEAPWSLWDHIPPLSRP